MSCGGVAGTFSSGCLAWGRFFLQFFSFKNIILCQKFCFVQSCFWFLCSESTGIGNQHVDAPVALLLIVCALGFCRLRPWRTRRRSRRRWWWSERAHVYLQGGRFWQGLWAMLYDCIWLLWVWSSSLCSLRLKKRCASYTFDRQVKTAGQGLVQNAAGVQ